VNVIVERVIKWLNPKTVPRRKTKLPLLIIQYKCEFATEVREEGYPIYRVSDSDNISLRVYVNRSEVGDLQP
jgi:hypothetical protein